MKAVTECDREDKDSLFSYIEKVNLSRRCSKKEKALWCVGVAVFVAISILTAWIHVDIAISWSVCVLMFFPTRAWVYFKKAEELAYGLSQLAYGEWWYMEMWFNDRKNQMLIFNRVMRSPAFILVVGFYYKTKFGDDVAAEKLLELARERDPDLGTIEMTSRRGLLRRDQEVLMENIRRDLGVTRIYKLKQKKLLWATGGLLLFLLFVIRQIMILVESGGLLIKGLSE